MMQLLDESEIELRWKNFRTKGEDCIQQGAAAVIIEKLMNCLLEPRLDGPSMTRSSKNINRLP
jgi:hypothetical protein